MQFSTDIAEILEKHQIAAYGSVDFAELLPLLECRAKGRLPANAQSVLVCLFPYYTQEQEKRNISRYAVVEDYHVVVINCLTEVCEALSERFAPHIFVPFTDNSPIREVDAAIKAGLGMRGKNQLLIHPVYGSYVFIGEIVTDMVIPSETQLPIECMGCGRCILACPGGAIGENGIDREKCLSHITPKKGELTEQEIRMIKSGNLIWGCDICQEVCPHNQNVQPTAVPGFQDNQIAEVAYSQIKELVKTRAFGFRGSKVVERNYEILYGKQD